MTRADTRRWTEHWDFRKGWLAHHFEPRFMHKQSWLTPQQLADFAAAALTSKEAVQKYREEVRVLAEQAGALDMPSGARLSHVFGYKSDQCEEHRLDAPAEFRFLRVRHFCSDSAHDGFFVAYDVALADATSCPSLLEGVTNLWVLGRSYGMDGSLSLPAWERTAEDEPSAR